MPIEIDEWAIGQRIASHRMRRGLTQEELSGLVGISLSMMKKIESGDRLVTRFSQLVRFAQILRMKDLRELTGVPLPLMPDGHRGHPSADEVRQSESAVRLHRDSDRRRALREASKLYQLVRTWTKRVGEQDKPRPQPRPTMVITGSVGGRSSRSEEWWG